MVKYLSVIIILMSLAPDVRAASVCYGTPSKGSLAGGVKLPSRGDNFKSYSVLGDALGRTYVHGKVRDAVVLAYAKLNSAMPLARLMHGETGLINGGQFRPHKTHQNGLSVDFMVPVRLSGKPAWLPASAMNRYGYDLEFDSRGRYKKYEIDFEAMAAHLYFLVEAAQEAGISVRRVIFDPALQPALLSTPYGKRLKGKLRFSKKRAWVRHDEHYHVDFNLRCRAMK